MYKILSLVNLNFPKSDFYSVDILGERVSDTYYHMVIYNIDTLIDFEDMRGEINNENVYRIAMMDDEDDKPAFESFKTHSWIFREKIKSLPQLVKVICKNRYLEAVAI